MPTHLKIDFVSDVSCPWCVVGLKSLEQALLQIGDNITTELHFQPFELNPHMAPEGENTTEHLAHKYGLTPDQAVVYRGTIADHPDRFVLDKHHDLRLV